MARDQSGGAYLSPEDRKASDRAGRKRLGETGHPQPALKPRDAADRTGMAAKRDIAAKGPARPA